MKIVRDGLAVAVQRLKLGATQDGVVDVAEPFATLASWVAVGNRLREVPEWPYIQSILVVSAVVSVAVPVARGVLFELLVQWLSLRG